MSEHVRRMEDTGLGKMVYFWPVLVGGAMVLISVGGYIATAKFLSDEQIRQEYLIENIQKTQTEQMAINARLVTLSEVVESRLRSIEDWRNGVSDIYVRHRR